MCARTRQIGPQKRERDTNKTSYGFNMADDTRKVRVVEQLKIKIGKLHPDFATHSG